MMLSMLLYNTGYSREKLYSLMPVILGVVLAYVATIFLTNTLQADAAYMLHTLFVAI